MELQGKLIATGVVVGIVLVLLWAAGTVGRRFVRQAKKRSYEAGARATTLWVVLRRVITFVACIVGVLVIFDIWNLSLAPFLAVGTVIAAAVGFGAQNFVRDVIAGFFLLAEDQFHVGDTITIAGTTGTVEDIQLRVTVLRDFEGNVHFVPNGSIIVTSNFTSQYSQPLIEVPVAAEVDLDRALAVVEEELKALTADPEWASKIRGEPEVLGIDRLDLATIVLRFRLTTVATERWSVRREAYLRLKRRLDAEQLSA